MAARDRQFLFNEAFIKFNVRNIVILARYVYILVLTAH